MPIPPIPEPDITLCLCLCKWHATLVLDYLLLQAFELLELIGAEACALLLFLLLLVVLAGLLLGGLLHGLRLLDLRKHRRLRDEVAEPLLLCRCFASNPQTIKHFLGILPRFNRIRKSDLGAARNTDLYIARRKVICGGQNGALHPL